MMNNDPARAEKVTLFLICSENPMPNLESFLYHYGTTGVSAVYLLADDRSKGAAESLKKILEDYREHQMEPVVRVVPMENSPTSVRKALKDVIVKGRFAGEIVINVTGGSKLMGFGAFGTDSLNEKGDKKISFEYWNDREGRYLLEQTTRGIGIANPTPDDASKAKAVVTALFQKLPVEKIVSLHSDTEDYIWKQDDVPDLCPQELVDLTQKLSETNWDWKGCWAKLYPDKELDRGGVFEVYTVNVLKILGLKNVALSMKKTSTGDIAQGMEVDVVFVHNGSVYLIDCKLGDAKQLQAIYATGGLLAQTHQASSQAKSIGGKFAKTLLLRPRYTEDMEARNKVAFAMGGRIIGLKNCQGGFFKAICDWLGLGYPRNETVRAVDKFWAGYDPSSWKKYPPKKKAKAKKGKVVETSLREKFDSEILVHLANQNPQIKWGVFHDGSSIIIKGAPEVGITREYILALITNLVTAPIQSRFSKTLGTVSLEFDGNNAAKAFEEISLFRRDRGLFKQLGEKVER